MINRISRLGRAITRGAGAALQSVSAPVISDPSNVSVDEGDSAVFSVTLIDSGRETPTYYWYDASDDSAVFFGRVYTISTTATSDNGKSFYCIAYNSAGSDRSANATLTVSAVATPPVASNFVIENPDNSFTASNISCDFSAPTTHYVIQTSATPPAYDVGTRKLISAISTDSVTLSAWGTPETYYIFPINDTAGLVGSSLNITVSIIDDTFDTAPSSFVMSNATDTSIDIAFTSGSDSVSGVAQYNVVNAFDGSLIEADVITGATISGIAPGITHTWKLAGVDNAGNVGFSNSHNLDTTGTPQTTKATQDFAGVGDATQLNATTMTGAGGFTPTQWAGDATFVINSEVVTNATGSDVAYTEAHANDFTIEVDMAVPDHATANTRGIILVRAIDTTPGAIDGIKVQVRNNQTGPGTHEFRIFEDGTGSQADSYTIDASFDITQMNTYVINCVGSTVQIYVKSNTSQVLTLTNINAAYLNERTFGLESDYGGNPTATWDNFKLYDFQATSVGQIANFVEFPSNTTNTRAGMAWDADGAASYYQITKDINDVNGWFSVGNQTQYTDTGLTADTTYSYWVRGVDLSGQPGLPSAELQITTDVSAPAFAPVYNATFGSYGVGFNYTPKTFSSSAHYNVVAADPLGGANVLEQRCTEWGGVVDSGPFEFGYGVTIPAMQAQNVSDGDEFWYRIEMLLPTGFNGAPADTFGVSTSFWRKFMRVPCPVASNSACKLDFLRPVNNNSTNGYRLTSELGSPSGTQVANLTAPSPASLIGSWVRYEWYTKLSASGNGIYRIFINDQLYFETTTFKHLDNASEKLNGSIYCNAYWNDGCFNNTSISAFLGQAVYTRNVTFATSKDAARPPNTSLTGPGGAGGDEIIGAWTGAENVP